MSLINKDVSDKKWLEIANSVFQPPVEEYEESHYEAEKSGNLLIVIVVVATLIISVLLMNTQAKANGNAMPISPASLVDYWGEE